MNHCFVFAYGSNLDRVQMRERCPSAVLVDAATLPRVRLVFAGMSMRWGNGGIAGIELSPRKGRGQLHGAVYRISFHDRLRLDAFEGHPTSYERVSAHPTLASGYTMQADVYMLRRGLTTPRRPSPEYLARIEGGYRALGLPLSALHDALSCCQKEQDQRLASMTDPAYEGEKEEAPPCRSRSWAH